MPTARKRFFISYSRDDRRLVEPVVALLRTAPTDVFFDLDTIEPGEDWYDRLEQAIKGASSFVIFWCDHSANSRSVQKEWMFAVGNKKRIIPILLDSTPLPPRLETFQWIDFRDFARALHGPEVFSSEFSEEEPSFNAIRVMAHLLRERLQEEP
jgi:TIR domain